MLRDLDLDLGSCQGHVNIHSTYRTTWMLNHVTVVPSNIDIGPSLNSRDSFPRWKFKNRAPISCSSGPMLWPSTISFELHTKMAEEINLEKCTFRKFGSSMTLTWTLDWVEVARLTEDTSQSEWCSFKILPNCDRSTEGPTLSVKELTTPSMKNNSFTLGVEGQYTLIETLCESLSTLS